MSEDKTDQGRDTKRRCAGNRVFQQSLPHTAMPESCIDINADLGRAAIRATRQEFFKIGSANHATVQLCDPERILLWRMFAEPRQSRFDRGWFKLARHHARR